MYIIYNIYKQAQLDAMIWQNDRSHVWSLFLLCMLFQVGVLKKLQILQQC